VTTKQGLNEVVVSAKARLGHSDIPIPRRGENKVPLPPGPGNALTLRKFLSPTRTPWFLADIANEYPDLAYMRFFGMDRYVVNSPELIVETFVNHANDLIKGPAFDGLKPIVGNGLLTAEGPTHLAHRRLVQPAFHRDRIAEYSSSIVELSLVHEKSWSPGQRVDMASEMVALTLAVVGRTLFGTDLSGDASAVGQSLRQLLHISNRYSAFGPALWRYPSPARSQLAQALATMDVVIDRIISENRAGSETGGMMSLLLSAQEDGDAFTDAQVRDEVMTLVSAGHETTAMTLTWAWLLLAQNAPELNWLHDELDEVLCGRPPTMEDLVRLPRTRAVIAEAIRLYPPIWLFGRRALTNIELGGWQVPEGANVMVSPFAIHRSPRFWPNASSFQPERWIGEDGAFDEHRPGVPRGAWIPFGFGKRKCIGEQFAWTESMLVLATLAQTWSPRLATDRPVKPETALSLRPKGGLPMVLERRSMAGS
jgi:cytochrome P450